MTLDHDLTALTLEADLLPKSVVTVLIGFRDGLWLWCWIWLIILLLLRLRGWVFGLRLRRSGVLGLWRRVLGLRLGRSGMLRLWLRRNWVFGLWGWMFRLGRSWVLWLGGFWPGGFRFGGFWLGMLRLWRWMLWFRRLWLGMLRFWLGWFWLRMLWLRMLWLRWFWLWRWMFWFWRSRVLRLRGWMLWLRLRWMGLIATVIVFILIFFWFDWRVWLWLVGLVASVVVLVLISMFFAIPYRFGYMRNIHLWRDADLAMVVLVALLTAPLILLSGLCVISTDGDRRRCDSKGQNGNDSSLSETHGQGRAVLRMIEYLVIEVCSCKRMVECGGPQLPTLLYDRYPLGGRCRDSAGYLSHLYT